MKYLLLLTAITACTTALQDRRGLATDLCINVYDKGYNVSIKQIDNNQIIINCGE